MAGVERHSDTHIEAEQTARQVPDTTCPAVGSRLATGAAGVRAVPAAAPAEIAHRNARALQKSAGNAATAALFRNRTNGRARPAQTPVVQRERESGMPSAAGQSAGVDTGGAGSAQSQVAQAPGTAAPSAPSDPGTSGPQAGAGADTDQATNDGGAVETEGDAAGQAGADGLSPEYEAIAGELTAERTALVEFGAQRDRQIKAAAQAEKLQFRQAVETAAGRVAETHDQVIAAVTSKAAADRQAIQATLAAELERVDNEAQAELQRVDAAVTGKQTAVRAKATEKEQAAARVADTQAARAQQGSAANAGRAQEIGAQKIAQYRNGENGSEIASSIRDETAAMVGRLTRTGQEVAGEVRRKAVEIGRRFRSEGTDVAAKMNEPRGKARSEIVKVRDKTKESLREMAQKAGAKISEEAGRIVSELSRRKGQAVATIRQASDALDEVFERNAGEAGRKVTAQAGVIAGDLDFAAEKVREGGWYPPFVTQAKAEITGALDTNRSELTGFAEQVAGGFAQARSRAEAELGNQSGALTNALNRLSTDFAGGSGRMATEMSGKLQEAAGKGGEGIRGVTPELEQKLQGAIDDVDGKWNRQLTERSGELTRSVDEALAGEDRTLANFGASLDRAANRIANAGFFDSLFDFVIGVFEGIGGALLKMVKGIWALVKEPLFWLAVAILVVVAAVLIIAGVVTLGGLLAFLGKALLVIGVIAGVIAAGWALYQMFTRPNLTWRERGRLFGEALTELVLAFAGTGILKRLGVFAQLGKLRRFVAAAGGIAKAARLIKRVPDLDKLILLLSKAKDAEKLILLLDRVKDADRLILLLDKVRDADQLLRLLNKVSDTAQLLRLLSHAKIADATVLERLLRNAKITDLAALERVLGNPKLGSVADLERALANAKIADLTTLDRLLSNTKLSNLAQLERLLANAKLTDLAQLERLLNNPKLGHAAQLERLLGNAKIADAAQLEQILEKVDRAGRMEAMLHMADNGAQLLDFLTRAGGADAAASLERLMYIAGGQGQLGRLDKLLAQAAGAADKFNEMARWTVILSRRSLTKPGVAEPADVVALGFTHADMGHFLDHTWEFVDIAKRLNKNTTFWPRFTPPATISTALGQALRNLNPSGIRPALPVPGTPSVTTGGGFTVQVGSLVPHGSPPGTPAAVKQFFPTSQGGLVTIPKAVMKAIWDILKP